jgi:hypothetical protein
MDDDPERRRCGTLLVLYMTHTSKGRLNISNSLLPQPDFPLIGRGTNLSNKINATESTNQLFWTALCAYIPALSIDEVAVAYEKSPEWLSDPFLCAALELGAYNVIASDKHKQVFRTAKLC